MYQVTVGNCIQRVVGSNSKYTNYLMNQPRKGEHAINGESQWLKNGEETRLKTPKTAARLA